MIFSVFDPFSRAFNYYEAPGNSNNYGARGTKYRQLHGKPQGPKGTLGDGSGRSIGPIGFAPEALGVALPANAKQVGRGREARGIVAVVAPQPEYPSRYEEHGGTITGVGGLGAMAALSGGHTTRPGGPRGGKVRTSLNLGDAASAPSPTDPSIVVTPTPISFGNVVVAACIASVVGVVVQKMLK